MRRRQPHPEAGNNDHEFDYVDLVPIARSMGVTIADLTRLSATGKFAPVIRLTERRAIARRIDLQEWEARAQVRPGTYNAYTRTIDTAPAEPFAHLQCSAAREATAADERTVRSHRRRRRSSPGNGATRAGVEAARVANTTESPSSELEVRDEV